MDDKPPEQVDPHIEHIERTAVLANERTYAAWVRTGLAALVSGLGVEKFLVGVLPWYGITFASMILIGFSFASFLLAAWRYDHVSSRMVSTRISGAPKELLHLLSGLLAIVSVSALLGLWIMH